MSINSHNAGTFTSRYLSLTLLSMPSWPLLRFAPLKDRRGVSLKYHIWLDSSLGNIGWQMPGLISAWCPERSIRL
ncbi:hypothetical protein HZ326_15263 [Fusarium oxysporum f. sp. albedinis]|nr:hypothetical protein HZ326_15263 [Fusarium oxysporum f. sp. albedinis]